MKINGKQVSRKDVLERVGSLSQIGSLRHYRLSEGNTDGVRATDFCNCSGFDFTVVHDRALDISRASYKGTNLAYHAPVGEVNPAYYNPNANEWLRTFFAGLLTTCGLTYFGHSGSDRGEALGLHGRIANIPARRVAETSGWDGDEYQMSLTGTIDESMFFGDKLSLSRSITSRLGERKLRIRDRVENVGYHDSPFTILYHINAGYPLLDAGSELLISSIEIESESRNALSQAKVFSGPIPNFSEQLFLHRMLGDSRGFAHAAIVNHALGLGLAISFDTKTLPFLNEWKMMGQGEYIVGLEPANTKVLDRGKLRELGLLPQLKPGEVREMEVEIGVLEGSQEIAAFGDMVERLKGT